ncbi:MAG TPA: hypothetical protein VGQ85_02860 [Candidatus Limnocylindrales bacterium]|nr:hypothetical protein [Candidatus Limnocylindrales bacterium]
MANVPRRSALRRGDYPLSIEQELADFARGVVHPELYRWKLGKYLLPTPGVTAPEDVRRKIETARDHEARMFAQFPDGPASVVPGVSWWDVK